VSASPSAPASNVSTTATSSQPVCSCPSSTGDPLASIIQGISAGIEGDIGSFVQGIIQNITGSIESNSTGNSIDSFIQEIISSFISGTGSSLFNSLAGSGSELGKFFSEVVGNFTANVDNKLSKAENSVAEGITSALGIQEFYSIHLRDVCSGTLSSPSDPNAKFNITACFPYSDAASGKS
jgi:hypothetical protein